MIQDIAPLHLYNEWHNIQPEKDDWIICMQDRKILVRGTQNDICFPRYAQIKPQVQNGDRFVYLFAVGEERFFLYQQHQYKEREELNLTHLCQSAATQREEAVSEPGETLPEEMVFIMKQPGICGALRHSICVMRGLWVRSWQDGMRRTGFAVDVVPG